MLLTKTLCCITTLTLFLSCSKSSIQSSDNLNKKDKPKEQTLLERVVNPKFKPRTFKETFHSAEGVFLLGDKFGVYIPPNSLVNSNKSLVNDSVVISFEEYYRLEEMLQAGLTTVANDNILQSDGMVNVKVTCNGQEVTLKENTPAIVLFKSTQEQYKLYYGDTTTSAKDIQWIEAPKTEQSVQDSIKLTQDDNFYKYHFNFAIKEDFDPANPEMHYSSGTIKHSSFVKDPLTSSEAKAYLEAHQEDFDFTFNTNHETYPNLSYIRFEVNDEGKYVNFDTSNVKPEDRLYYHKYLQYLKIDYRQNFDADKSCRAFLLAGKSIDMDKFYKAMYFEDLSNVNIDLSKYNIFEAFQLNWLNLDKPLEVVNDTNNLVIHTSNYENTEVYLSYRYRKSIIRAVKRDGQFVFFNPPYLTYRDNASLIALQYNDAGAKIATQIITKGTTEVKLTDFQSFTFENLTTILREGKIK